MPRLQQSKRIGSLEGKLSALKASRNWFRDRYIWASSYFKKNKPPFMYPWKASDAPPRVSHTSPPHDSTINAIREIQNCLVANFNIDSKHRRYAFVYKLFSFSLYSMSSVTYDFLRHFIVFPCAKLLRKEFSNDIREYASELRDINTVAHIIARQSLPTDIQCILCVDAFSVNISKSKPSTKWRRARSEAICGLSVEDRINVISEEVGMNFLRGRGPLFEKDWRTF
jgi:hypothetical protein